MGPDKLRLSVGTYDRAKVLWSVKADRAVTQIGQRLDRVRVSFCNSLRLDVERTSRMIASEWPGVILVRKSVGRGHVVNPVQSGTLACIKTPVADGIKSNQTMIKP